MLWLQWQHVFFCSHRLLGLASLFVVPVMNGHTMHSCQKSRKVQSEASDNMTLACFQCGAPVNLAPPSTPPPPGWLQWQHVFFCSHRLLGLASLFVVPVMNGHTMHSCQKSRKVQSEASDNMQFVLMTWELEAR